MDSAEGVKKLHENDKDPGFVPNPRQKIKKINTITWGAIVIQRKSVIKYK